MKEKVPAEGDFNILKEFEMVHSKKENYPRCP